MAHRPFSPPSTPSVRPEWAMLARDGWRNIGAETNKPPFSQIHRGSMLRRFFTVAPDSLWQCFLGHRTMRWGMLWGLIWIFWMFGDLLFVRPLPTAWWPVTIGAFLALLALIACIQIRPRSELPRYTVAMGVIACLIMPINHTGSGTCIIYACVYLALRSDVKQMLAGVVPLLLLWSLETWLLHWPWQAAVWVVVIALAVSFGQHSMWAGWAKDAELRLSYDEVRRLAASAERERIGRDLHDLLGHTLSMVALKSELAGRLIERDPQSARREMADVERVARDALSQVRSAVSGIRAAALASEFASARLLLETVGVRMEYWADPKALPSPIETCLALVLREAVTNIQRHARANGVEVSVIVGTEQVVMRVRDDGRGGVNDRGNGLTGMRERVSAQGGELWIDSPRGKGTAIEVRVPLANGGKPDSASATRTSVPSNVALLSTRRAGGQA